MLIAPDRGNLHKIVILNPKGGCGKTTLATNIAAYYANRGPMPTLVDLDPKGYSMRWLDKRDSHRPAVHGGGAFQSVMQGREAIQLQTSSESEALIIDLPAAIDSDDLRDVTYNAGSILIPVLPSAIDVNCASRFIAELLLLAQIDRRNQQLAVVANRTRQNTRSFRMLSRFLGNLSIPLIAILRDSQNYVHAAGLGIGICEMPSYQVRQDITQLERIIDWLDRWRVRKREATRLTQFGYVAGPQAETPHLHPQH